MKVACRLLLVDEHCYARPLLTIRRDRGLVLAGHAALEYCNFGVSFFSPPLFTSGL